MPLGESLFEKSSIYRGRIGLPVYMWRRVYITLRALQEEDYIRALVYTLGLPLRLWCKLFPDMPKPPKKVRYSVDRGSNIFTWMKDVAERGDEEDKYRPRIVAGVYIVPPVTPLTRGV